MILNERVLLLIITLAEKLHFGRAAAALHVSQSALSGTVKNLERDLCVRIFQRTSRSVRLTAAGEVLVAEARRLLQESERAVALVRQSSSDVLGPLRIGYAASMNLRWLGGLIAEANDVEFVSADAARLHEDLSKRTLNAAFVTGPFSSAELKTVRLFREPLLAVVGCNHALAGAASVTFEQLRDEPVVWLGRDSNHALHNSFVAMCGEQGYRPRIVQEADSFYECLQFAKSGVGITFLPRFMQGEECARFLRLPDDSLHVDHTLAYASGSQGVERFVKLVKDRSQSGIDRRETND